MEMDTLSQLKHKPYNIKRKQTTCTQAKHNNTAKTSEKRDHRYVTKLTRKETLPGKAI